MTISFTNKRHISLSDGSDLLLELDKSGNKLSLLIQWADSDDPLVLDLTDQDDFDRLVQLQDFISAARGSAAKVPRTRKSERADGAVIEQP